MSWTGRPPEAAKWSSQWGQAVITASAPTARASSMRSAAVQAARSGLAARTPPPAPQHQEFSRLRWNSNSSSPGTADSSRRGCSYISHQRPSMQGSW